MLDWYDEYLPEGKGRLHQSFSDRIEDDFKDMRRAQRKSTVELYPVYCKTIMDITGWLWSKGYANSNEYPKNNEKFLVWPSHIDMMLSYLEDFIGGDLIDELMEPYLNSQFSRKKVDGKILPPEEEVDYNKLIEQWKI